MFEEKNRAQNIHFWPSYSNFNFERKKYFFFLKIFSQEEKVNNSVNFQNMIKTRLITIMSQPNYIEVFFVAVVVVKNQNSTTTQLNLT